jgi:ribonucleoside-diphosphate reductase alpha chain
MQAALQAFVDNSISKTINFPNNAKEDDVADAYMHAWKLGCKGITVYLAGSREKEVLETNSIAAAKQEEPAQAPRVEARQNAPVWLKETEEPKPIFFQQTKKPRPRCLMGFTYGVDTPVGKTFVTVNENGDAQPFEVFINTAKAGTDVAADSEAIARLISYILRLSSPVEPSQRLQSRRLNLGGGRPMGFGQPSALLPDGGAGITEYVEAFERLNMGKPARRPDHRRHPHGGGAVDWVKERNPPPCASATSTLNAGTHRCNVEAAANIILRIQQC